MAYELVLLDELAQFKGIDLFVGLTDRIDLRIAEPQADVCFIDKVCLVIRIVDVDVNASVSGFFTPESIEYACYQQVAYQTADAYDFEDGLYHLIEYIIFSLRCQLLPFFYAISPFIIRSGPP